MVWIPIVGVIMLFLLLGICYYLFKKIEQMEKSEAEHLQRITAQYENLKLTNKYFEKQQEISKDENAVKDAIDNCNSNDDVLHVVNNIVQHNNEKASAGNNSSKTAKKGTSTRSKRF